MHYSSLTGGQRGEPRLDSNKQINLADTTPAKA